MEARYQLISGTILSTVFTAAAIATEIVVPPVAIGMVVAGIGAVAVTLNALIQFQNIKGTLLKSDFTAKELDRKINIVLAANDSQPASLLALDQLLPIILKLEDGENLGKLSESDKKIINQLKLQKMTELLEKLTKYKKEIDERGQQQTLTPESESLSALESFLRDPISAEIVKGSIAILGGHIYSSSSLAGIIKEQEKQRQAKQRQAKLRQAEPVITDPMSRCLLRPIDGSKLSNFSGLNKFNFIMNNVLQLINNVGGFSDGDEKRLLNVANYKAVLSNFIRVSIINFQNNLSSSKPISINDFFDELLSTNILSIFKAAVTSDEQKQFQYLLKNFRKNFLEIIFSPAELTETVDPKKFETYKENILTSFESNAQAIDAIVQQIKQQQVSTQPADLPPSANLVQNNPKHPEHP